MPLFYVHLINDVDVPDCEGKTLADLDSARLYAVRQARALMAAVIVDEGRLVLNHRIDIEDEDHARIASVDFGEAVIIEG